MIYIRGYPERIGNDTSSARWIANSGKKFNNKQPPGSDSRESKSKARRVGSIGESRR
jgi:hypothetical protein